MAITFDGPNLRIILESGVFVLDAEDLYSRWKDFSKTGDNSKFPFAFDDSFGGNPLPGALEAGPYFTFRNDFGWRLRPPEEDINITLTGNLIPFDDTLGATGIVVPTLGAFTTAIIGIQPVTQGTAQLLVFLKERTHTDPATGIMTIFDESGGVLFTANIFEDVAGAVPYAGGSINRRDRFD